MLFFSLFCALLCSELIHLLCGKAGLCHYVTAILREAVILDIVSTNADDVTDLVPEIVCVKTVRCLRLLHVIELSVTADEVEALGASSLGALGGLRGDECLLEVDEEGVLVADDHDVDVVGVDDAQADGGDANLGLAEEDVVEVGRIIAITLKDFENRSDEAKQRVAALCKKYPLYE